MYFAQSWGSRPPVRATATVALQPIEESFPPDPEINPPPTPPRFLDGISPSRGWDESLEPIVTRPEPLEDDPRPPLGFLPGSAEESEVSSAPAPRPDRETRRMPYADEQEDTWATRVFRWMGLGRVFHGLAARPFVLTEESEEPPIQEDSRPTNYHPSHCPHHGHCPYPYQYRNPFPY